MLGVETAAPKDDRLLHGPGIEPGPPAWQARILPLNHPCNNVQRAQDSVFLATPLGARPCSQPALVIQALLALTRLETAKGQ